MKLSANRQSALEEIYRKQPISIHNVQIEKRYWSWLERNDYIKITVMSNIATVTAKGHEYLTQSY